MINQILQLQSENIIIHGAGHINILLRLSEKQIKKYSKTYNLSH